MRNSRLRHTLPVVMLCVASTAPLAATPILTLLSSGDIAGDIGETVGWGFTITNSPNYIVITSAQFCLEPVNFPASCMIPSTGAFQDFISAYNYIVVGPTGGTDPDTVTQSFDPDAFTGIGSIALSSAGTDIGQIVLTYDMYTLDPDDLSSAMIGPLDQVLSAAASITAFPDPPSDDAPEPATATLILLPLAILAIRRRQFR